MTYNIGAIIYGCMTGLILCAVTDPRWKSWITVIGMTLAFLFIEYSGISQNMICKAGLQIVIILGVGLVFQCGDLSERSIGAGIATFASFSARYAIQYLVAMVDNKAWLRFYHFVFLDLSPEAYLIYLAIFAIVEIGIYFVLRIIKDEVRNLEKNHRYLLAGTLVLSCLVMALLMQGINHNYSTTITQSSISTALGFIILSVVLFSVMIYRGSTLRSERKEYQMLVSMNHAAREGYQTIIKRNTELRGQVHDFKNHLRVIQKMTSEEADEYIQELLDKEYAGRKVNTTGDSYIDAVIEVKLPVIREKKIRFDQNIRYPGSINISPSDLCAIISNQLDNAIEACIKIEDPEKRWIRLTLDKKGDMVGIICENSIVPGSLTQESLRKTSKRTDKHLHGFGIRNIRLCAEKNGENFLTRSMKITLFRKL